MRLVAVQAAPVAPTGPDCPAEDSLWLEEFVKHVGLRKK